METEKQQLIEQTPEQQKEQAETQTKNQLNKASDETANDLLAPTPIQEYRTEVQSGDLKEIIKDKGVPDESKKIDQKGGVNELFNK